MSFDTFSCRQPPNAHVEWALVKPWDGLWSSQGVGFGQATGFAQAMGFAQAKSLREGLCSSHDNNNNNGYDNDDNNNDNLYTAAEHQNRASLSPLFKVRMRFLNNLKTVPCVLPAATAWRKKLLKLYPGCCLSWCLLRHLLSEKTKLRTVPCVLLAATA